MNRAVATTMDDTADIRVSLRKTRSLTAWVGLRNVAEQLRARFQANGQFSSVPSIVLPWRIA
ncbi:MAG: hypothetical protein BGO05_28220 [Rhizobiales bacterium 63-7]|nr:MAG: hypothetical protein BGO05_28220 [Rhizobiales bacterium 63-7]